MTDEKKARPRALRDGTTESRFAARYATIDEVAALLGGVAAADDASPGCR